jgi:hypothetical protein
MPSDNNRHEIATKPIVYRIADDSVTIQRDIPYGVREGEQITLDLYLPPGHATARATPRPAVLFVIGYSDQGFRRVVGCPAKEMESYISWARLMATCGVIGITYENRTPETDALDVLSYIRNNAARLGIDRGRIALWACSGNVPTALSALMQGPRGLACAALCYGFMLDLDGAHDVADAARAFRFANPCVGRTVEDLPPELPLLVVRAGRDDFAGLNATIDAFVAHALALNRPVSLVNHYSAPHAFDIVDDSDVSREIIRQIIAFMRFHLRADEGGEVAGEVLPSA